MNAGKHPEIYRTDRWLQDVGEDVAECTPLTNRWDVFNVLFNCNPWQQDKRNHPSIRLSISDKGVREETRFHLRDNRDRHSYSQHTQKSSFQLKKSLTCGCVCVCCLLCKEREKLKLLLPSVLEQDIWQDSKTPRSKSRHMTVVMTLGLEGGILRDECVRTWTPDRGACGIWLVVWKYLFT